MRRPSALLIITLFVAFIAVATCDRSVVDQASGRLSHLFQHEGYRGAPYDQMFSNENPDDSLKNRLKRKVPFFSKGKKTNMYNTLHRYADDVKRGARDFVDLTDDEVSEYYGNARAKAADAADYMRGKAKKITGREDHGRLYSFLHRQEHPENFVEQLGETAQEARHRLRDLSSNAIDRSRQMFGMEGEKDESYVSSVGRKIRQGADDTYERSANIIKRGTVTGKNALQHQAEKLGFHPQGVGDYISRAADKLTLNDEEPGVFRKYYNILTERLLDRGHDFAKKLEQFENDDQQYYEFAGNKQRQMDKKLKNLWEDRMNIVEDAYHDARHDLHRIGREGREPKVIVKNSMQMIRHLERELEAEKFKLAFVLKDMENECE